MNHTFRALHKHIQPHRQEAIKSEARIVCVEMREVYQAYRQGIKCDAKVSFYINNSIGLSRARIFTHIY